MDNPRHSKAPTCLRRGIFDELKSFRELEARIGALATAQERGDAFEVFAEAYLATVAVEKAKQVWPGAGVPPSLRQRLALTIGDNGVDGILETALGEIHAYQAKFRTGRPSLTWNELSTFIGLADRVDQRVLITNCDRFAGLVKERTVFQFRLPLIAERCPAGSRGLQAPVGIANRPRRGATPALSPTDTAPRSRSRA